MGHKLFMTGLLGFFPSDSQPQIGMAVSSCHTLGIILLAPYT